MFRALRGASRRTSRRRRANVLLKWGLEHLEARTLLANVAVSVTADRTNYSSVPPEPGHISADGRYVVFSSTAQDMVNAVYPPSGQVAGGEPLPP